MKKTLIASLAVLGCAAVVATLALGGGPKLNAIFEAKATDKNFTFDAATGSQFEDNPEVAQEVNVETGSSDPIWTKFVPKRINSVAFGEGGRFVETHPNAYVPGSYDDHYFSLDIGTNNLTHFAIDVGVVNDGGGEGYENTYFIALYGKKGGVVGFWYSAFELDGNGNGTKHIEWDKGVGDDTVIGVSVSLHFDKDSTDTSMYIESVSLAWAC